MFSFEYVSLAFIEFEGFGKHVFILFLLEENYIFDGLRGRVG